MEKLTDKEYFAYICGLMLGGRLGNIVKTAEPKIVATTINKGPITVGPYKRLTIGCSKIVVPYPGIGEHELSIFIARNSESNRGISGFQFTAKFRSDMLTYKGYSIVDFTGNVIEDNSLASYGKVKLTGIGNEVFYDDRVLIKLRFEVIPDLWEGGRDWYAWVNFTFLDLITTVDGNTYTISPYEYDNGYIQLYHDEKPEISQPKQYLAKVDNGFASSRGQMLLNFELNCSVSGMMGATGGNLSIRINTYSQGILIGSSAYPLSLGGNVITGNMVLDNSKLSEGYNDFSYEAVIENNDTSDDTKYYLLIPAFGFNATLTTIIDRESLSEIPIKPIYNDFIQSIYIKDAYDVELISQIKEIDEFNIDEITINDTNDIELNVAPKIITLDNNVDSILIEDTNDMEILQIKEIDEFNIDEITINDTNDMEILQIKEIDEFNIDEITINDTNDIELNVAPKIITLDNNVDSI